jgi:Ino eighty subunit 1
LRGDVQYDLLDFIFSDSHRVFTSPNRGKTKVNFRELYVDALYNSNKCSKVLRDKMLETPAFSIELAKISLLTNVGRINTTMACERIVQCLSV